MLLPLLMLTVTVALAFSVGACPTAGPDADEGGTAQEAEGLPPQVVLAVTVARAVEADPDAAEAVLRENDLSIEQFEALMYRIAADPELSAAFEAAME